MRNSIATAGAVGALIVFGFSLGAGCSGLGVGPSRYAYFSRPDQRDAWSPKIAGWQRRERSEQVQIPAPAAVAGNSDRVVQAARAEAPATANGQTAIPSGDLRDKYFGFRAERKRAMARDVAQWIQAQAEEHYVADGEVDHWATLEETLTSNGDDCDGLELLTFHALRELGFAEDEVYRAIVYRPSDGQHHMVTLWFERRDDPWVIDPTGAMTRGMPRMSELPAWVPLKVFSDTREYTVRAPDAPDHGSSLAAHE